MLILILISMMNVKAVAWVDTLPVTVEEFKKALKNYENPDSFSTRKRVIDSLICEKLFLLDAENKLFRERIKYLLKEVKKDTLLKLLYNSVIKSRLPSVDSREVYVRLRLLWHRFRKRAKLWVMEFNTKDTAWLVFHELRKGKKFDELAMRYSKDLRSKKDGGFIGWVNGLQRSRKFMNVVFSLKKGQISLPFKDGEKYYIVMPEDFAYWEERAFKPFASLNKRREVVARMRYKLINDYYSYLEWLYGLQYNDSLINELAKRTEAVRKENPVNPLPYLRFKEHKMWLCRWDNKEINALQFINEAMNIKSRIIFNRPRTIKKFLRDLALSKYLLINQAKRMLLHKSPRYYKAIQNLEDKLMVESYKREYIWQKAEVTWHDVYNYYKKHKKEIGKRYLEVRMKIRHKLRRERIKAITDSLINKLTKKYKVRVNRNLLMEVEL